MSASLPAERGEAVTWKQIPINEVFLVDDVFYTKMSPTDVLRIKPMQGGSWIGYGVTFKYDPSWKLSFTRVGTQMSAEALRRDLYRESRPLLWMFWVISALFFGISLIGLATWWLVR